VSGLNAVTVPFKTSGDVQLAIQRGDVDAGFESYAAARGSINGGKLIAVATTGPKRTPWLPQVPTTQEAGLPDYEVTGWNAIYAPRGISEEVIALVGNAVRAVIADAKLSERMLQLGVVPGTCTPDDMAKLFERDRRKWQDVIRKANIKV
jgi:tripartite-type tricarboxylate transporter receptor subunit TctC